MQKAADVTVLGRAALLLVSAYAVAAGLGWLLAAPLVELSGAVGGRRIVSLPLDRLLPLVCAVMLAISGAWVTWILTLTVGETVIGVMRSAPLPRRRRGCPRALRRWLIVGCSAALSTGLATAPATAAPATGRHEPGQASAALTGLSVPDRVTGAVASGEPVGPVRRGVVVGDGDTLWSLAARALPGTATDARIGLGWRSIYEANQDVIGADPDLLVPGTHLKLPQQLRDNRKDSS